MKRLTPLVLIAMLFANCSPSFQVMFTAPITPDIVNQNSVWTYENDTIKVTYSFWSEDGVMSFNIKNKLTTPIYIDWKKSAQISDGKKLDYWQEGVTTNTTAEYKSRGYSSGAATTNSYGNTGYGSYSVGKTIVNGQSISVKDERISFIPPKSSIDRSGYALYPNQYSDLRSYKRKIIEGTNTKALQAKYTPKNTEMIFSNYFTYSTKETFDTEVNVNNEFYICEVWQLPYSYRDRLIQPDRFWVTFWYNQ